MFPHAGHSVELVGLEPHTSYSVTVESLAAHPNDEDADSSAEEEFVNRAKSQPQSFRTTLLPSPPPGLHAGQVTEDSVDLYWETPAEQASPELVLVVRMWRAGSGSVELFEGLQMDRQYQLTPETTHLKVDGLGPKTEYSFSLNYMTLGQSSCSCAHALVSRLPVCTSGVDPPRDLGVVSRTPTSIRLKWRPAVPYGSSTVLHYVIHYMENKPTRKRSHGQCSASRTVGRVELGTSHTEAVLRGLDPGTVYRVTAEAVLPNAHHVGQRAAEQTTLSTPLPRQGPVRCLSDLLVACTTAPPEKPKLLVSGLSCSCMHFCWDSTCLLAPGTPRTHTGWHLVGEDLTRYTQQQGTHSGTSNCSEY